MLRVLALEPYYGGSHRAFLDGWSSPSRHAWTVLTLPAYKWKWRMRHAAVTLAEQVDRRYGGGERWDVLWCSAMLNLAELLGLVRPEVRAALGAATVAYFHESQFGYPARNSGERDLHFAFTNITTALAAGRVWFNSRFHREQFFPAARALLARMPDHQPLAALEGVAARAEVHPPGVNILSRPARRRPGPLRILWAARWEHDKNPEAFFAALDRLLDEAVEFRVSVIGEQFSESPPVFGRARQRLGDRIERWGFQANRHEYEAALRDADVLVSTADHEFFGISVVEAIGAGAYPLLPRRLSYPELLEGVDRPEDFLYDGRPQALADRLARLADRLARGDLWAGDPRRALRAAARFSWERVAPALDDALEAAAQGGAAGLPPRAE